jgi:hypothetical protein
MTDDCVSTEGMLKSRIRKGWRGHLQVPCGVHMRMRRAVSEVHQALVSQVSPLTLSPGPSPDISHLVCLSGKREQNEAIHSQARTLGHGLN